MGTQNVLLHDIYLSAVFISCRVGTGGGRPNGVCVCVFAPSRCFKASMMSPLIRAFKYARVHVSSGVGCRRGPAIAHATEFRTLAKQFCLLPGTLFFAVLLFFKLSANWREGLNVRSFISRRVLETSVGSFNCRLLSRRPLLLLFFGHLRKRNWIKKNVNNRLNYYLGDDLLPNGALAQA